MKAIAVIVFLSLITQCCVQLGVWGYYQANKDYIAKNLCENRNKPQMKCCGKCYLKKQLKKVDDNTPGKKTPVKSDKSESTAFIISDYLSVRTPCNYSSYSVRNPTRQNLFGSTIHIPVFHPPSLFC